MCRFRSKTHTIEICQKAITDAEHMEEPETQDVFNAIIFRMVDDGCDSDRLLDFYSRSSCSFNLFWCLHNNHFFLSASGFLEPDDRERRALVGSPIIDFHPLTMVAMFNSKLPAPPSKLSSFTTTCSWPHMTARKSAGSGRHSTVSVKSVVSGV